MNNDLKILLLAPQPFFQNRGTPIATKILARELKRLGHNVELLVFFEGEDISIEGVRIHRIPKIPFVANIPPSLSWKKIVCDIVMFFSAWKLVRKGGFDIIHSVEESVFIAMILKILYRIPYVYDMDSSLPIQIIDKLPLLQPFKRFFCFFEKKAIVHSDGVVAVCQELVNIALHYETKKNIVCLEDISLLEDDGKKKESDEKLLDIEGVEAPILLYIGNLEGYQGIDLLLESFQIIVARNLAGTLVVIGGTEEHVLHYKKRAQELDIKDRVYFLGARPVELLGHFLEQADILLSPRIQGNNTPMKLYSYLDSGRAVLATKLPTHTQVLQDNFALLVEPEKESMAEGLAQLIKDKENREALGKKGQAIAQENYSLATFQKKLTHFYEYYRYPK